LVFPSLNCRRVSGPALIGGSGQRIIGFTLKLLSCPGNDTGAGGASLGIGMNPSGLALLNVSFNSGMFSISSSTPQDFQRSRYLPELALPQDYTVGTVNP
jgi:hypothetical protein